MATIRPNSSGSSDPNQTTRPNSGGGTFRPGSNQATVRPGADQGGNNQATVRPGANQGGNNQATVRPGANQGGNNQATVRPGANQGASLQSTIRPGGAPAGNSGDKTARPTNGSTTGGTVDVNVYQPRASYTIAGVEYKVLKALSLTSGEAQVFLVTDPKGLKQVLKLYYKGAMPNTSVLNKVKSVNDAGMFFKEYSHGAFEDRYYELMKFYDGENLENVDARKNEATISQYIGKMASAIDLCHQLGFIHRDIKPSNFIFETSERKNILLGDFGIAVECDATGKCVADMARTKIYAAPEVYLNTGDGKARFNTKSDFYSLGIVILYMWMGKDAFSHFEKENELQLATMKAYGNLPIPSAMPLRLFSLVKALVEPNPDHRAGFKEIEAWLKGGNPFGTPEAATAAKPAEPEFEVVFKQGQTAHSPKELARFMMEDKPLAISYLYKGRMTVWFENNKRPELAIKMEQIKEDLYPQDKEAGLQAACCILNPAMPFTDIVGNSCSTSAEIANSILKNFDRYEAQIAKNANSPLLVYLQMHGLEQAVADFRAQFAKNNRLGLLYLAYRLDPAQPWYATDDDGQTVSFKDCDAILNWVKDNDFSDQSRSDIVSEAFFMWVNKRNPVAAAAIKPMVKRQGDETNCDGVLYRLNPKTGLYFVLDEKAPNYVFTVKDLSFLLNVWFLELINDKDESGMASSMLSQVFDIQNGQKTNLYHFLQSKGSAYAKYIDWIKYCLDINSDDNVKKAGPYSDVIGFFKLIKGMGDEVFYTFKSGKTIHHPSELSTVSRDDINDALNNNLNPLEAWITVFYQEEPHLDKGEKYSYEQKTAEYIQFLISQGIETPAVRRYLETKEIVEERAEKANATLHDIKKSRVAVFCISIVPLLIAAVLLALLWRPGFGGLKFGMIFKPVAIITVIFCCFVTRLAGKLIGEIIIGALLGALITWILVLLSKVVCAALPFIVAIAVALLALYFYKKCIRVDFKEEENDDILNPGFEHTELEPIYEAFHPTQGDFDSSIGDRTAAYQRELSAIKKTMWVKAVPVGVITIAIICYALISGALSSKKHNSEAYNIEQVQDFSNGLYGTWVGSFDEDYTSIEFEPTANSDEFKFYLSEFSDTPIMFSGTFDPETNVLEITDTDMKDAVASGTLTLDGNVIYGDITVTTTKRPKTESTLPIYVQYES